MAFALGMNYNIREPPDTYLLIRFLLEDQCTRFPLSSNTLRFLLFVGLNFCISKLYSRFLNQLYLNKPGSNI